jgi:SHS2 domain-containing protein
MDFRYLEHTADAEFIAYGRTPDEAFVNAARAMFGLVVDPSKVRPTEAREISLTAGSL